MELEIVFTWSWTLAALVILSAWGFLWKQQNQAKKFPNGNTSLPIIGETLELFRVGPRDFIQERVARYGDSFTVSFMGRKGIVVNSPDAVRYVLSSAHKSFPQGYSSQFRRLTSEGMFQFPSYHLHLRKIVLGALTGQGLLQRLPFINSLAEKTVTRWENMGSVNIAEEMKKFAFLNMMNVVWRNIEPDSKEMEQIIQDMNIIAGGLVVLPINLPGFFYHKALKVKQALKTRIKEEISKRRKDGKEVNDVLNAIMNIKEVNISDHNVCRIMVGIMFAGYKTTSSFIPWVIKYLHDYPEVRQCVQEEQDSLQRRIVKDESLTWFKSKLCVPYTLQVVNEILRIETLVAFLPRIAGKDVEYNGLVIPRGTHVWAALGSPHFNPLYYSDPWAFDPSRFEESPMPNTFMPFGNGPHICPGSELAIAETLFLIHHLITKYSWERVGPDPPAVSLPFRTPDKYQIVVRRRAPSEVG